MKLLWITPECPYPANTGGRICTWKRIVELAKRNEIYLYTIIDQNTEVQFKDEILKVCKSVNFYTRSRKLSVILGSVIKPYSVISRHNKQMQQDIERDYKIILPDYIVVDFPQMMENISLKTEQENKIILNQHNNEFLALKSISTKARSSIKRFLLRCMSRQMHKYEKKLYRNRKIQLFTFVSIENKNYFESIYGLNNTMLVPIGTDCFPWKEEEKGFTIAFFGKMSYHPNIDASIWFVKEVFPLIKKRQPQAQFFIVGKDPVDEVRALSQYDSVTVTGTVDSLERFYRDCAIVVIPLFAGDGVKVKLLEALGHGKLVVTTPKGIEGTVFADQNQLLVADTAQQFADICVSALQSPSQYTFIRKNGWDTIQKSFTWDAVITELESYLEDAKVNEQT